jgi:hypothetical protein
LGGVLELDIVVDIFLYFVLPSSRFGSIAPCWYDLETFPCQFYWYIQAYSRDFQMKRGMYVCVYKITMRHGLVARCQNTDFNNLSYFMNQKKWGFVRPSISVISWRSVLLWEETEGPGENHRSVASHWQTLSHNVVSSTPRHERDSKYKNISI